MLPCWSILVVATKVPKWCTINWATCIQSLLCCSTRERQRRLQKKCTYQYCNKLVKEPTATIFLSQRLTKMINSKSLKGNTLACNARKKMTTASCLPIVYDWERHETDKAVTETFTIAGSWLIELCCSWDVFGGSQTWRSLMSLPRNIMYSKISSRGGTGWSVGRSSVPNDFTEKYVKCIIYKVCSHFFFQSSASIEKQN